MLKYKKEYRGFKLDSKQSRCWIGLDKKPDKLGYLHVFAGTNFGENLFHRAMWVKTNGPIPKDHDLHHLCEIEACGRPKHLELVHHNKHRAKHTRITKEQLKELERLRNSGWTLKKLAKKFGYTYVGLHRVLSRENLCQGVKDKRYLSLEQKKKILKLYTSGQITNCYELGRMFGKTGEALHNFLKKEGVYKKAVKVSRSRS